MPGLQAAGLQAAGLQAAAVQGSGRADAACSGISIFFVCVRYYFKMIIIIGTIIKYLHKLMVPYYFLLINYVL